MGKSLASQVFGHKQKHWSNENVPDDGASEELWQKLLQFILTGRTMCLTNFMIGPWSNICQEIK